MRGDFFPLRVSSSPPCGTPAARRLSGGTAAPAERQPGEAPEGGWVRGHREGIGVGTRGGGGGEEGRPRGPPAGRGQGPRVQPISTARGRPSPSSPLPLRCPPRAALDGAAGRAVACGLRADRCGRLGRRRVFPETREPSVQRARRRGAAAGRRRRRGGECLGPERGLGRRVWPRKGPGVGRSVQRRGWALGPRAPLCPLGSSCL